MMVGQFSFACLALVFQTLGNVIVADLGNLVILDHVMTNHIKVILVASKPEMKNSFLSQQKGEERLYMHAWETISH